MDDHLSARLAASGYDRPGFAQRYDGARPRPPEALKALLAPLLPSRRPRLVVDLGAGTGLSTRFWSDLADEVIGVEPNPGMRAWAERATAAVNVRYIQAPAEATGLDSDVADLVTAAQSMQWMDPARTLPEIGRILRSGGVLCIYQYRSLQTPLWEPEASWERLRDAVGRLRAERGLDDGLQRWPVSREAIDASGMFSHVRETVVHSIERGDGARLVELALSEGSLQTLLADGVREEDVGLDRLRRLALPITSPIEWWLGYSVWLARRK